MRLVFVNHMHPDIPHVSGMRSWYFGRELAKRGHQVVQICEAPDQSECLELERVPDLLRTHRFDTPLLLPIRPQSNGLLALVRSARTPVPLRKALIVWNYFRHSGMFTDFNAGVQPYLPVIAREFRPDAVWGLFGNTDCWLIAQRLARLSGCPWIGDMKDSWEAFIRPSLRGIVARRLQDMAGATVNSEFNGRVAQRWFSPRPVVVYSGVETCFLQAVPVTRDSDVLRFTLTGAVRDEKNLHSFVIALVSWLERQSADARTPVEVVYAGADSGKVRSALARVTGLANVTVHGYLPLHQLASLCRSASLNAYIWNSSTFHHKLLELLCCGRPVLAYPGETQEARDLAEACGGTLEICGGSDDVHRACDAVKRGARDAQSSAIGAGRFSWPSQALVLEAVFASVCRRERVA